MRWRYLRCQLAIQGYPPHYGAAVSDVVPPNARLIHAVSAVHSWAVLALCCSPISSHSWSSHSPISLTQHFFSLCLSFLLLRSLYSLHPLPHTHTHLAVLENPSALFDTVLISLFIWFLVLRLWSILPRRLACLFPALIQLHSCCCHNNLDSLLGTFPHTLSIDTLGISWYIAGCCSLFRLSPVIQPPPPWLCPSLRSF